MYLHTYVSIYGCLRGPALQLMTHPFYLPENTARRLISVALNIIGAD